MKHNTITVTFQGALSAPTTFDVHIDGQPVDLFDSFDLRRALFHALNVDSENPGLNRRLSK